MKPPPSPPFPKDDRAAMVTSPSLLAMFRLFIVPITRNRNITTVAGGDVDLACEAENFAAKQWLFLGGNRPMPVSNSSDLHRVVTPDFRLLFRGIQPEDQGVYKCALNNVLGSAEILANITVVGKLSSLSPRLSCAVSPTLCGLHVQAGGLCWCMWVDSTHHVAVWLHSGALLCTGLSPQDDQ